MHMTPIVVPAPEPIRISRAAEVVDQRQLAGLVVVLCEGDPSRHELQIFNADMLVVRTREEFLDSPIVTPDAYLVLASGLSLAKDVLQSGLMKSEVRVIWALGQSVAATLGTLQTVGLPPDTVISAFAGLPESAVLVAENSNADTVDLLSFRIGLAISAMGTAKSERNAGAQNSTQDHAFRKLAHNHLNTLQSLGTAAQPLERSTDRLQLADAEKLENDLILLKRRYDALNRKYNSLASSRLGQLTLKIWERKRVKAGVAKEAKEYQR